MHAPVEDEIPTTDVRHAHRAVMNTRRIHDMEHVAVPRERLQRVAAIPGGGRVVDGREIVNRAVLQHRGPGVDRHEPESRIGVVAVDLEVDDAPAGILDEPQFVGIADAVVVGVVPEQEPRGIGLGGGRVEHHVARIGARRVLPREGLVALSPVDGDSRDRVAARHAVRECPHEEFGGDRRPFELPRGATANVIVAGAEDAIPQEPGGRAGVRVVRPIQVNRLVQGDRCHVLGRRERRPD